MTLITPLDANLKGRLEAISQAHRLLREATSLGEIHRLLVRETATRSRAAAVSLLLYTLESDALQVAASHGEPLAPDIQVRGEGLAWQVMASPKPLVLRYPGCAADGLGFPLRRPAGTVGVLLIAMPTGESATLEPLTHYYLETLVQAAATALTRLTTLAEAEKTAARFREVAELSIRLDTLSDPEAVAEAGLRALTLVSPFEAGLFSLRQGDDSVSERCVGVFPETLQTLPDLYGHLYGHEAFVRAQQSSRRVYADAHALAPLAIGLEAALIAPVQGDGGAHGHLTLLSFVHPVEVDEAVDELLGAVALRIERAIAQTHEVAPSLDEREASLKTMGLAAEYRDYDIKGHTERVTTLALRLAQAAGPSADALRDLRWGAYLHDVGKVAIPDSLLMKPSHLSPREWRVIERHPIIGEEILKEMGFIPQAVVDIVRHHHERWDGTGYPDGLAGDDIPYLARLFAVVDVYDALTNARPYKRAWAHEQALYELRVQKGRQLDPQLVELFLRLW